MQRFFLLLLVPILVAVSYPALSSSMHHGPPIDAEVKKVEPGEKKGYRNLTVILLQKPRVPKSSYYDAAQYKKGGTVTFSVEPLDNRTFKPGQQIQVRWRQYSAMGPNGPVGGLSWEVFPVR